MAQPNTYPTKGVLRILKSVLRILDSIKSVLRILNSIKSVLRILDSKSVLRILDSCTCSSRPLPRTLTLT